MARMAGQIKETAPGRWLVRAYEGRSPDGKRRYVAKAVQGSRRDAERALRGMLGEKDAGRLVRPSRRTLAEYLAEWLETAAAAKVSGRTLAFYREQVQRYIAPDLGAVRLDKLTPAGVQRWLNGLKSRGLSPRTIRAAYGTLHAALRQAVRGRLLAYDPSDRTLGVELGRAHKAREVAVLDAEHLAAFVQAAAGERLEAFFLVAVATGMRPGELAGLRWKDVDFKAGAVTVRQAMTKDADGKPTFAPPKTERGERTIALPPAAVEALKVHRARQREERFAAAGSEAPMPETVFVTEEGKPLSAEDLANVRRRPLRRIARKAFMPEHVQGCDTCTPALWLAGSAKLCAEGRRLLAEVHKLTLYSLRHSSASALVHAGVHVRAVSERLGHASEAFTLATYIKSREDAQRDAADRLQDAVFSGTGGA